MKARVPLYAFMPYGAPELLEAQRAHMSRALFVASLLAPAALLAAFAISSRFAATVVPPGPAVVDLTAYVLKPPPTLQHLVEPGVPVAPPSAIRRGGDVVPVDDSRVDPSATIPSQPELREEPPGAADAPEGSGSMSPPVEEALPEPGDFVHAEEYPTLVSAPRPEYPEIAKEAGVEGTVVVLALVGRDGRVLRTRIAPRGSVPMLDEAALAGVRRFVFTPALDNGHPAVVWVRVPVVFRLR